MDDIEAVGLVSLKNLASADDPRSVKLIIDTLPTADNWNELAKALRTM